MSVQKNNDFYFAILSFSCKVLVSDADICALLMALSAAVWLRRTSKSAWSLPDLTMLSQYVASVTLWRCDCLHHSAQNVKHSLFFSFFLPLKMFSDGEQAATDTLMCFDIFMVLLLRVFPWVPCTVSAVLSYNRDLGAAPLCRRMRRVKCVWEAFWATGSSRCMCFSPQLHYKKKKKKKKKIK